MNKKRLLLIIGLAGLLLLGCYLMIGCGEESQSINSSTNEAEINVKERAEKYYQALASENFDVAYEIEHEFIRKNSIKDESVTAANLSFPRIKSFSIGEITIKGITAGVDLSITCIYENQEIESKFKDIWMYENGDWYHVSD